MILEMTLYNNHFYIRNDGDQTSFGITSTSSCGPEGFDIEVPLRREKNYQTHIGRRVRFDYIWSCEFEGPIAGLEKEVASTFDELLIVLDGEKLEFIEHAVDPDGEVIDTDYIVEVVREMVENKYPSIISTRIS
jgi:hypothetical protein